MVHTLVNIAFRNPNTDTPVSNSKLRYIHNLLIFVKAFGQEQAVYTSTARKCLCYMYKNNVITTVSQEIDSFPVNYFVALWLTLGQVYDYVMLRISLTMLYHILVKAEIY